MDISRKFEEARSVMKSYGKDCMILAPSTDLRYLSGFHGISMERPILLILTLKKAFFVLPEFELDNLREELKSAVTCISWKEQEDPYAKAAQALEQENICHAVFGNQMQAVMFYRLKEAFTNWRWEPAGPLMAKLRSRKEEEEYQCAKRGWNVWVRRWWQPGRTARLHIMEPMIPLFGEEILSSLILEDAARDTMRTLPEPWRWETYRKSLPMSSGLYEKQMKPLLLRRGLA